MQGPGHVDTASTLDGIVLPLDICYVYSRQIDTIWSTFTFQLCYNILDWIHFGKTYMHITLWHQTKKNLCNVVTFLWPWS